MNKAVLAVAVVAVVAVAVIAKGFNNVDKYLIDQKYKAIEQERETLEKNRDNMTASAIAVAESRIAALHKIKA